MYSPGPLEAFRTQHIRPSPVLNRDHVVECSSRGHKAGLNCVPKLSLVTWAATYRKRSNCISRVEINCAVLFLAPLLLVQ
jgi:hypothetical protein